MEMKEQEMSSLTFDVQLHHGFSHSSAILRLTGEVVQVVSRRHVPHVQNQLQAWAPDPSLWTRMDVGKFNRLTVNNFWSPDFCGLW